MRAVSKKRRSRRRTGRSWLRRLFIASSVVLAAGLVTGTGLFAFAWARTELPPDVPLSQTTVLTDADGQPLARFNSGENRTKTSLENVPESVRRAILDVEDRNFYNHRGVDPRGVLRALYVDLRDRANVQGGSTVTQQYVKNAYVGSDRTSSRKIREAIIAMKLERKLSKDEIFERYLNAIYFGRSAYGIQAASKAYFNKNAEDLTLAEGAYLAGLIRAPELADAYKHPEVADARRDATLDNMVRFGSITVAEADAIKALPVKSYVKPKTSAEPAVSRTEIGTQYFVDYVKQALSKRYGEDVVEGGGLRVTTSLDLDLQAQAYDAVYGFLKPGEPAGALVSVDEDGAIRAMVGGRDYSQSQVNLATGAAGGGTGRQAGSIMKPFALAAAIEEGAELRDTYDGSAKALLVQEDGKPWPVDNFENQGFGRINLTEATVRSVNTAYARLGLDIGIDKVADMAHDAGIKSEIDSDHAAIVLGANEVTVLEMAGAYMTFGSRGQHVEPNPILEVRNADGELLERVTPERDQVMTQSTADTVNYVLEQNVKRGTGKKASIGKPLAGKTGTTEENGDAWFVGYTPKLATAVWMGYPEGNSRRMENVRGISVTGGTFPAEIFARYMSKAVPAKERVAFTAPPSPTTIAPPVTVSRPPTIAPRRATTTTRPKLTTTSTTEFVTSPSTTTTEPRPPATTRADRGNERLTRPPTDRSKPPKELASDAG